jgi:sugar lactone lactonase YvrE
MKHLACLAVALVLAAPALAQDMALSSILVEGQGWQPVAKGFQSVAGLAVDAEGRLYVADGGKRIARVEKDGTVTTVVETPAAPAGVGFTPGGALLVCLP